MIPTIRAILTKATLRSNDAGYLNAAYANFGPSGQIEAFALGRTSPDGDQLIEAELRLRMASISKAATARAACALAVRGVLPLDEPATGLLGWHTAPDFLRQTPPTVRHLLSHTSGLTDRAGYLPDGGESVMGSIERHPVAISQRQPGSYFAYANINYLLLGHVMEAVSGKRFDRLLCDEVLRPAGITGGFNWAGVPLAERARRLALYQRQADGLSIEADGDNADWQADLIWRGGRGHDFATYRLAQDTCLLSPHAGLRMNVIEAARLARFLADGSAAARLQADVAWQFDPAKPNGEDCDGLFTTFGLGLTIYHNHPRIPGNLIGHAGHALGFTGGIWYNRTTDVAHAYFLTGARDETAGLDTETFYGDVELAIMKAL